MKDLFPGYFKESETDLRAVWDTSLFVFDANILLNLYRYSDTTRSEFLRILEKINERAWLPHRAAEEYLNNRLSVIDQQERSYDETTKSINLLKSDLDNARQHPFVSQNVMEKVDSVFTELCDELQKNKAIHTTRISNDEIKESISSIFENSVGMPYEKEELEKIIIDGEERYRQKIPPGFKDSSKSSDAEIFIDKCRKYGDLIVWYQVIDKAIELDKGVVFVTDDKKDDWWQKFKGKTVGPRPELVKEFKDRAGSTFHMYQADRFLELARENLDEQVSEEIVEEIREVRRRDMVAHQRRKELQNKERRDVVTYQILQELEHSKARMMGQQKERKKLKHRLKNLEKQRAEVAEYHEVLMRDGRNDSEIEPYLTYHAELTAEYDRVGEKFEISAMRVNETKNYMRSLEKDIADREEYDRDES